MITSAPPSRASSSWNRYRATITTRAVQDILNGVLARGTHLAREAPDATPGTGDLQRVRAALWRLLPGGQRPDAPLRVLAEPLRAEAAMAVVNLGVDPHAHLAREGLQLTTTRSDPLCFGAARTCLVQSLDYVVLTSWGEVHVRRFEGADGLLESLCQHLGIDADALAVMTSVPLHPVAE